MIKAIKRVLPVSLKTRGRRFLLSLLQDTSQPSDSTRFIKGDPVPPQKILRWYVDAEAFLAVGRAFCQHFVDLCDLKPNARVLDAGCGPGRIAIGLTHYLSREGSYEGFDTFAEHIQWATRYITPRHPNFHFTYIDLYNSIYNAHGKVKSTELVFPYPDGEFDLVFLASVFTHMIPQDVDHYMAEIQRVMKPGAFCLITYFVLNDESLRLIKTKKLVSGATHLNFPFEYDGYRLADPDHPEEAIAYDEQVIRSLYAKHGLSIVEPIHGGSWCKRAAFLSFQDIVVARKPRQS